MKLLLFNFTWKQGYIYIYIYSSETGRILLYLHAMFYTIYPFLFIPEQTFSV